jgi:NAD(P)-dependent dehydrogenase (short-subunit alcohol dehydrogenase family)
MNYVKSLAKQLGPKGIRVNAVAPWSNLDSFAGVGRCVHGKTGKVWQPNASGAGRTASRVSLYYVQLAAADASFAIGQVYGSSGGSGQP